MFFVVPGIEVILPLGRHVHGIQKQTAGIAWRSRITRRQLYPLKAEQQFTHTGDALRPG